jgi:hypothetical protein
MSLYADQIGFAAGVMIGTSLTASPPTPRRFGILQDATLDFSADVKELYGQNRYAIALAPGKTKVSIKAKFASIRGSMFNDLYFGAASVPATQTLFADSEAGTVPGSSTYTVTVSNSAMWLTDQGVFRALTGQPFTRVTSGPTSGQYSVAAGIYTFAVADASVAVYISYTYSSVSGLRIPITNLAMGAGPAFSIVLSQPFDGRQVTYQFNNCQASKLSLPTKQDDFTIAEMDFMIAADVSGNIGFINTSL